MASNIVIAPDTTGVYQVGIVDNSISPNLQNSPLVVNNPGTDTHTIQASVLESLQNETVFIQIKKKHPQTRNLLIRIFITQTNFDNNSLPENGIFLYPFTTTGGGIAFQLQDIENEVPAVTGRLCSLKETNQLFAFLYMLGNLTNQNPDFPLIFEVNGVQNTVPNTFQSNDISHPYSIPIPDTGDIDLRIYDDPANASVFNDVNNLGRQISSAIQNPCTLTFQSLSTGTNPEIKVTTAIPNIEVVDGQQGVGVTVTAQRDIVRFTEDGMTVVLTTNRFGTFNVTITDRSGNVTTSQLINGTTNNFGQSTDTPFEFDFSNKPALFTIDPDNTGTHPSATITVERVIPQGNPTNTVQIVNSTGIDLIYSINGNQSPFIHQQGLNDTSLTYTLGGNPITLIAPVGGYINYSYEYAQTAPGQNVPNVQNPYMEATASNIPLGGGQFLIINDDVLTNDGPGNGGPMQIVLYFYGADEPLPTTTTTSTSTTTTTSTTQAPFQPSTLIIENNLTGTDINLVHSIKVIDDIPVGTSDTYNSTTPGNSVYVDFNLNQSYFVNVDVNGSRYLTGYDLRNSTNGGPLTFNDAFMAAHGYTATVNFTDGPA